MTLPRQTPTLKSAAVRLGLTLVTAAVLCPASRAAAGELSEELKKTAFKIVYETYRENNWELFMVAADGSDPVNLTRTADTNEIYPHVSPDGTKLSFLVEEGDGEATVRNAYYMNSDGTDRRLIARNVRWSCWSPDGTLIAYVKGEPGPFSYKDNTSQGLFIYDPTTGRHQEHPNKRIHHIYNICWSADGNWFVATVSSGMGYRHTNLALEANGTKVFDLGIGGCRPDLSPDGKKVAWGVSDWTIRLADLDLTGPEPKLTNQRDVVTSSKPVMVYHVDWSPDGRYVAFSRGPVKKRLGAAPAYRGARAEGWNICVADARQKNRWVAITSDGNCNKEPDWVPVREKRQ